VGSQSEATNFADEDRSSKHSEEADGPMVLDHPRFRENLQEELRSLKQKCSLLEKKIGNGNEETEGSDSAP